MNDSAATQLAQFCARTTFEDLPADLVARTKRHILDTLGATLAGSAGLEPRETVRLLAAEPSAGTAPVWGTALQLGSRDAAFANGMAAHALELDDCG
ncbi:MAG: 2-methylcitrate dehydratase, partial [Rhodoferax sp.]|nr:2-methylcitrate dehydratase [Rhodoferax sp.]